MIDFCTLVIAETGLSEQKSIASVAGHLGLAQEQRNRSIAAVTLHFDKFRNKFRTTQCKIFSSLFDTGKKKAHFNWVN